jgi:hypothetical protein
VAESLVFREPASIEPESTTQSAVHQDDILREISVDELQHHCSISGAKEFRFLDHGGSPDNISIKHLDSGGLSLFCPEQLCLVKPYASAYLTLVNNDWLTIMRYDSDWMHFASVVRTNHSYILAAGTCWGQDAVLPVTAERRRLAAVARVENLTVYRVTIR